MADLDYAFLADYAAIQEGKLNASGASFTKLLTSQIPAPALISVAGRVRIPSDVDGFNLGIKIIGPYAGWQMEFDGYMSSENSPEYNGKRGILFALQSQIVLISSGLHEVEIGIDGELARTLKFDVSEAA